MRKKRKPISSRSFPPSKVTGETKKSVPLFRCLNKIKSVSARPDQTLNPRITLAHANDVTAFFTGNNWNNSNLLQRAVAAANRTQGEVSRHTPLISQKVAVQVQRGPGQVQRVHREKF
jgi:hypothetical protein